MILKKIDGRLIISIASLLIAFFSLFISYQQYNSQNINYEKEVQPYVTIVPTIDPEVNKQLGFYFFNGGLGVAYVNELKVTDSSGMETSLTSFGRHPTKVLKSIIDDGDSYLRYGMPIKGTPIVINTMEPFITCNNTENYRFNCVPFTKYMEKAMGDNIYNFEITLIYSSIYGKKYEYSFPSNITRELD
ncbi:TPA: hypothetical protein QH450_001976 [Providencia alcalifaciens]|uniref:hypothetical protein n=1 Tax=Providencia alcalifaciens TaxID=126385 RepID=UPI00044B62F3|nr:hypothetical protein [Providencia alcalifaciens]ETT08086.1 hypothetical protein HMPREF1562_0491 [Providencia alcalifaciens F90-2004]MTC16837.1 hypothetical protein [Providencia alcalifaciens]HEF8785063.1 hypothetical protein [Providencia alcalifaciens]